MYNRFRDIAALVEKRYALVFGTPSSEAARFAQQPLVAKN